MQTKRGQCSRTSFLQGRGSSYVPTPSSAFPASSHEFCCVSHQETLRPKTEWYDIHIVTRTKSVWDWGLPNSYAQPGRWGKSWGPDWESNFLVKIKWTKSVAQHFPWAQVRECIYRGTAEPHHYTASYPWGRWLLVFHLNDPPTETGDHLLPGLPKKYE